LGQLVQSNGGGWEALKQVETVPETVPRFLWQAMGAMMRRGV